MSSQTHISKRARRRYASSKCLGRSVRPLYPIPLHTIGVNLNQGYQRAGHITLEELALIKKVDRQPKAKAESLLLSDGQTYASLYLGLLKKLQRVDTLQSILVLIADALSGMSHRTCACLYPPYLLRRSRRTHHPVYEGFCS
jgi:hypothetical protein